MTETLLERLVRPPLQAEREAPFTLVRDADGSPGDGMTLDGFAAVFNRQTVIDSWEGRFKEQIAPGAMKKSFRENPPVIQFDHGKHPMVGSIPIAAVQSIREETDPERAPDGGAHIVARLFDNWLIQPVRDAIAAQAIGGMSFRFGVVGEQWHDADGTQIRDEKTLGDLLMRSWVEDVPDEELLVRTLKELRVPELGPVVWPAYRDTSVGVRSLDVLSALTDPQVRAEVARALVGTPSEPSEAKGASGEGRAATTDDEPGDHSRHVPSPQARQRQLILEGVLSDG